MRRSSRFQRPGLSGSSRSVVLLGGDGGGPSLALDFSSGTLDPRITFTRSTIGTFYRGAFNQNLVTQSETFSGWYTDGATPATSGESNPQNSGNAYGITESATTAVHRFGFSTISARQPSSAITVSAYVKAGLRTLVGIQNNAIASATVTFQLTGSGSYGTLQPNVISASITFVGNGWYRCSATLLTATNGGITPMIYAFTGTLGSPVSSYAGDNTAPALYVWGVQTTEGSLLTPYIPTTTAAITQGQIAASQPWNLLLQSQAFDNTTSWANAIGGTGVNPVRTANNAVAPDGTTTADTITFNTGANTTSSDLSFIQQTPAFTVGPQYTLSFWIRGTVGGEQLTVRHLGGGAFTLVTATTSWQRISITETSIAGTNVQIGIRQNISGHGVINATATVELWGAQINEGPSALDYSPTTTLANYLPRFEYNPVSGAFRGLLIEGGATNLLQQSAAVRTSPWVIGTYTTAGSSITAPDGTNNGVELVASNGAGIGAAFTYQQINVSAVTAYTASFFLKAKGTAINTSLRMQARASTTTLSNLDVTFDNANGTVGAVTSGTWTATSATSTPVGNGWYRVTLTGTTPATTDNIRSFIFAAATGNGTDGVYAWGAQVEAQAFASSYIPTVGGTIARGADLANITGSAFSSWFNQSEGTLYAEQQVYALIGNSAAAFIQQDASNYYEIGQGVASLQANMVRFYVQLAGGNDVVLTTTLTGLSVGNTIRSAAAYRVNDVAFSGNANTVQTDNTFTIQTPVSMGLGRPRGGDLRSILLRRISYWPTRLPNDQLVSLTTIPSTALAMTAIQAGAKIDLTWTQVAGVEGAIYEVERSTDGGATWSPLTTSFGLAFNDTTALFPGTYTYRVRANVGGEVTDWSSQVSETTVDVPSAPGSLTVTGATTSSISLSWTDSTGEDFYGIEVSPDGLGSWSLAGTVPANTTTFTHTPLAESVQRYYRVNGLNKAGGGVYSSTVNSWTVPLAPTSLTATAVSSTQIDLAWTDVSTGNQSYKVERSTDNVNWTQIATGLAANATSYSAVGLTGSTLYYFRVRAANAARDSAYSNTASATTQAGGLTPAWSLDFSTGSFSGATLTRSSAGTFVDSSGYVASASNDVARLTHDKTGARLGLLVEGSATNVAQYSEDFSNVYWTKSAATIDDNGGAFWTSPANTSDAVLLEQTTAAGTHRLERAFSGTDRNFAIFVKKQNLTTGSGRAGRYVTLLLRGVSTDYVHATFDLDTGTKTAGATVVGTIFSGADAGIEAYANDWYRVWITATRASGTAACIVALATTGTPTMTSQGESYTGANATDGIYVWGAQSAASNAPPTSYIETPSNASVTRSADLVHVLDSAITSWGDPGALVVHFYPPGQAGTLISTDDAATAQVGIEASTVTDVRAFWSSGSTAAETMTTGVQKAVHYWTGSTSKLCLNGGPVRSGTNDFTIANADFVTLGAEATESGGVPGTFSQYANCIIRKVEFYSGTLTDANLQTITT